MITSGSYNANERNGRTTEQMIQDISSRNDRSGNSVKNERTTVVPETNSRSVNPSGSNTTSASRLNQSIIDNTTKILPAERSASNRNPVQKEQYRYTRTKDQQNASSQRNINQISQREKPTPRYSRPTNATTQSRTGNPQSYSSPAYRQPKSSQEYINPRPQTSTSNSGVRENSNSRSSSTPSNSQRRYTSPSNNATNSRQSASPSSNPSRSYTPASRGNSSSGISSPSRSSSPSYSAPSRSSSPSYSAPSRSGGSSSGGSRSSGGGGGGSRSSGGGGKR